MRSILSRSVLPLIVCPEIIKDKLTETYFLVVALTIFRLLSAIVS